MIDEQPLKNRVQYECVVCDYITANKTDFKKHNLTRKHITLTRELTQKSPEVFYTCNCGKEYKHRQSLFSHKKTCKGTPLDETTKTTDITNQIVGTNQFSNELLYNLLKEIAVSNAKNDELKNMVVEQNAQLIQQNAKNDELKHMFIQQNATNDELKHMFIQQNVQLMELANKPSTINNNNNNTTMNKPKFNLNLFLNEECKNAMNWLEFAELVKSKICFADLEYMGKHGYVAGQSKIIKDNLQNIEVNKRPFHCTDIKRKTVHIKDQDEWKREEGHSTTLTKLVNKIEHTENVVLYDWIQTKPDCYKHNSPDNKTYMDIATAITKHAHGDNQDKALGEVLQNVMVERT